MTYGACYGSCQETARRTVYAHTLASADVCWRDYVYDWFGAEEIVSYGCAPAGMLEPGARPNSHDPYVAISP